MGRFVRVALLACGFLAVGGTVAWASGLTSFGFVGSDGSITACVQNSNGSVRFTDPSSMRSDLNSCRNSESTVVLNQKGQKGDPGSQGPPGSSPGSAHVMVDCTAGGSVQQALDDNADATSVDIVVKGTCKESVNIGRDNVSLDAFSAGDGLAGQNPDQPVLAVEGRRVQINGLTITGGSGLGVFGGQVQANNVSISGGSNALNVNSGGNASISTSTLTATNDVVNAEQGGSVQLNGVTVQGTSNGFAVAVGTGGTVSVGQSTISGARDGVIASPGGSAQINNTTIKNNTENGLFAFGGSIQASGGSITGTAGPGVSAYAGGYVDLFSGIRIASNNIGVATFGGRVLIQNGVVIENNTGDGLQVSSASSAAVEGPATIQNNAGNGVHIQDNSVASFGPSVQITGNGGWGIFCDGPPSNPLIIGAPDPTDVSPNTSGGINCKHG
jgi:hypothetical protein